MVCWCPAKPEQRNPTVKGIKGLKASEWLRRKIVTVDLEKGKPFHELLPRKWRVSFGRRNIPPPWLLRHRFLPLTNTQH
jgi:hypothetical protein